MSDHPAPAPRAPGIEHVAQPAYPGLRVYLADAMNQAEHELREHMTTRLARGDDVDGAIARTNALAALLNAAAARCQLEARRP